MLEVLTMTIFVFSSIYGAPTEAFASTISASSTVAPLTRIEEQATNIPKIGKVEQKTKEFFRDDPILIKIAECESQFRQYDANGRVLKGQINKGDLGLMQINKYYHADKAKELGFDLKTIEGNMAYAKYLYDHEGVRPWLSSLPCWKEALKSMPDDQLAVRFEL